jgi:hypothetical protein
MNEMNDGSLAVRMSAGDSGVAHREAGAAIQGAYALNDFTAGWRAINSRRRGSRRIDHRSYAQPGIDRESENKIGAAAARWAVAGERMECVVEHMAIRHCNALRDWWRLARVWWRIVL